MWMVVLVLDYGGFHLGAYSNTGESLIGDLSRLSKMIEPGFIVVESRIEKGLDMCGQ